MCAVNCNVFKHVWNIVCVNRNRWCDVKNIFPQQGMTKCNHLTHFISSNIKCFWISFPVDVDRNSHNQAITICVFLYHMETVSRHAEITMLLLCQNKLKYLLPFVTFSIVDIYFWNMVFWIHFKQYVMIDSCRYFYFSKYK